MLVFFNDGKRFLTGCSYDYLRLFDTKSGKLEKTLNTPRISIKSYKFIDKSQQLVWGVMPQTLQLWDIDHSSAFKAQQWTLPKPSDWRPTASLVLSISQIKGKNTLVTIDTRGYVSFWKITKR